MRLAVRLHRITNSSANEAQRADSSLRSPLTRTNVAAVASDCAPASHEKRFGAILLPPTSAPFRATALSAARQCAANNNDK